MAEQPYGLIATFDTASGVYHAAEAVRDAGYKNWDCITPYPVHGLDKAMGLKRSLVPVFSLAGGIGGVVAGVGLIAFTAGFDYKLILAGRPFFSPIPAIPVIVELGIALSAFSAVAGMIVLCRFPMLYHPVLKSDRIISALDDKYLIVIEARDPMYSPTQTKALLEKMGGQDVKEMEA